MSRKERFESWRLQNCNTNKLPQFGFYGNYLARVIRCIDGDTIEVALVFGSKIFKTKVRFCGVDAPELRPSRSDPHRNDIKREAQAAKQALEALLPTNAICILESNCALDCYGRMLACRVWFDRVDIVEEMIMRGYAVRIDGKVRQRNWQQMWHDLQTNRLAYAAAQKKTRAIEPPKQTKGVKRLFRWFCF